MLGAKKDKQKKEKKPKKVKVKKEKKPKKEKKKKEKKPKKGKTEKSGKSKKKLMIIGLVVIVILLGAGFAAYTFLFKDGSHEDSKKDEHTKTEQSEDAKHEKESESESESSEETTEPAVDANPIGEVSYMNYLRISLGDSYQKVVMLLGEEGKETSSTEVDGLSMKEYNFGSSNEITVAFVNDQMVKKSKSGLKEEIVVSDSSKETEEKKTEEKEHNEKETEKKEH